MYAADQITEYLNPVGKMIQYNLKKEIQLLAEQIEDDEYIESVGLAGRGFGALKLYLVVLTSKRLLTTDKKKEIIIFDINFISNSKIDKKLTTKDLSFLYNKEEITISLLADDFGHNLISNVENALGITASLPVTDEMDERKVVRGMKPVSLNISILNGKEQLKDNGSVYKLSQTKQGEIEIKVDYHNTPETFKLIKWERVENVQKSAFDIAGWALIGSTFGNAGAIAGAMGANIGKDVSVATLFLKRANGDKVPLVIKCDKKDLQKLSLLLVTEEDEVSQVSPTNQAVSAADEILKFKHLLDEGILTQEEFDSKKKQLLGI